MRSSPISISLLTVTALACTDSHDRDDDDGGPPIVRDGGPLWGPEGGPVDAPPTSECSDDVAIAEVPEGLSMITGRDRNDIESARIRFHLPRFAGARVPEPDRDDWKDWESLLSSREAEPDAGPHGAMSIVTDTGFGTMSSSLIALPSVERSADAKPIWRFSAARPDSSNFMRITL